MKKYFSSYTFWKWKILIVFSIFYTTNYLGRFNFWPMAPLIRDDLSLTHVQIGLLNAAILWGFCFGDVVHGSLSEKYGFRKWIFIGAILTTVCNILVSYSSSFIVFLIPWFVCGFVNAACWAPGVGMVSQWWERKQRGFALGVVSGASGTAMLVVRLGTGLVGATYGWRVAFRYPPILISVFAVLLLIFTKDFPSEAGFKEKSNQQSKLFRGFKDKYIALIKSRDFHLVGHIKGLENVVRYGLMTWIPLYYYDKGGFDISSTLIVTVMLPIGYALAPPIAGFISDKFLLSNRKPLTFISCVVSALVLFSICIVDPSQTKIGASLMLIGGISLGMSQLPVMAVDFFGKEMAATTSALVDAHGYLYAGIQAVVVSLIVGLSDNWIMVFVLMGMIRVISAVILLFVRPGLRS